MQRIVTILVSPIEEGILESIQPTPPGRIQERSSPRVVEQTAAFLVQPMKEGTVAMTQLVLRICAPTQAYGTRAGRSQVPASMASMRLDRERSHDELHFCDRAISKENAKAPANPVATFTTCEFTRL